MRRDVGTKGGFKIYKKTLTNCVYIVQTGINRRDIIKGITRP